MSESSEKGKQIIKEWFEKQTHIRTIVDLGCGSGTYPKLLGDEYVWKGVEIYYPYVKEYKLEKLYREIRIGDIQYMNLPGGDCAILGDVLEHLPKKAMIKTFKKVNRQFGHVVVSIPLDSPHDRFKYQSIIELEETNPFEKHSSVWTLKKLDKLIPPSYKVREVVDTMAIFIK